MRWEIREICPRSPMWCGRRDARGLELIVLDEWQLQELRARTESEVFERVISIAPNRRLIRPVSPSMCRPESSAFLVLLFFRDTLSYKHHRLPPPRSHHLTQARARFSCTRNHPLALGIVSPFKLHLQKFLQTTKRGSDTRAFVNLFFHIEKYMPNEEAKCRS